MTIRTSRIALGTAQFGLRYGIANATGKVEQEQIVEILHRCKTVGIDTLDTAIAYGNSESELGQAGTTGWRVVSKLPEVPGNVTDIESWVVSQVERSLGRLRHTRLNALLLHRPAQLLDTEIGDRLYNSLCLLKAKGLVERIGVSIYDPEELTPLLPRFSLDIVQSPFSILDQRIQRSGYLDVLSERGIEVFGRSAFLQGLLLLDYQTQLKKFERWKKIWRIWQDWLQAEEISPVSACLRYALSEAKISKVVVGVDNLSQLEQILREAEGLIPSIPDELYCDDPQLVNPSNWRS